MGMKADRRTFLKLSSGAGAAALGGLSSAPALAQGGATLTAAWDTDIDSLDPHVFKSVGGYAVQCNLYDPVVSWKVRPVEGTKGLSRSFPGEFEGSIAESWSFERDGATIVLKIRPAMKFPSGRPVDAAALKYSLDRALQSPGYMRFIMPRMIQVSKADDIVVRDPMTIAIDMKGPTPQHMVLNFLSLMTITALDPELVKPNATEKDPWAADWAKRNPAGSGPYTLAANTPGVEVVLEARKDHWRGVPAFQKIALKFVPNEADRVLLLKRKAIDLIAGTIAYDPSARDLSVEVAKAKATGAEALLIINRFNDAILITRELIKQRWTPMAILSLGPGWYDDQYLKTFGKMSDGPLSFVPWQDPNKKLSKALEAALGKAYPGSNLNNDHVYTFEALLVAADAYKRAGSTDPKALADAIRTTNIIDNASTGPGIQFNAKGQNDKLKGSAIQNRGGKHVTVAPSESDGNRKSGLAAETLQRALIALGGSAVRATRRSLHDLPKDGEGPRIVTGHLI